MKNNQKFQELQNIAKSAIMNTQENILREIKTLSKSEAEIALKYVEERMNETNVSEIFNPACDRHCNGNRSVVADSVLQHEQRLSQRPWF